MGKASRTKAERRLAGATRLLAIYEPQRSPVRIGVCRACGAYGLTVAGTCSGFSNLPPAQLALGKARSRVKACQARQRRRAGGIVDGG